MSKFTQIFTAILIFGVFFAFPAPALDNEVTKADLQNMYIQSLREVGFLPIDEPDVDGDIRFMFSGRHYYIIINEKEPMFFRIYRGVSLGAFSSDAAITAANELNMSSMIAKFYISSDGRSVAINTELLLTILPNSQDMRTVLTRALNLMRFAEDRFFSQLEGNASSSTVSSAQ